ncbi:MAG: hypothetical protein EPN88_10120 [Bacteroidetes bacterium]|nr:MAG: hypothetical protein EPN88_10120 [Bacteroidota bacterium]
MKIFTAKTSLIILMLCLMGTGCKKSNGPPTLLEITPESASAIIQNETKQIEFKFCLINKDGQSATVFNEGEDFTFSFSFKNNGTDTIIVTTEFINTDFFRVFSLENNIDVGKPWTGIWCQFSLSPHTITLPPSYLEKLTCPWILTENNTPVYPLCMGESKEPLMKGEYNTFIDLDFHFSRNGKLTIINQLKFKINFKVI